jgi:hypothetical protein
MACPGTTFFEGEGKGSAACGMLGRRRDGHGIGGLSGFFGGRWRGWGVFRGHRRCGPGTRSTANGWGCESGNGHD